MYRFGAHNYYSISDLDPEHTILSIAFIVLVLATFATGRGIVRTLRTHLDDPTHRCARCRYPTAALPTPTCPECGHKNLNPKPRPPSRLPRRIGLAIMSVVWFFIAFGFMTTFSFEPTPRNQATFAAAQTLACLPAVAVIASAIAHPRATSPRVRLAAPLIGIAIGASIALALVLLVGPPSSLLIGGLGLVALPLAITLYATAAILSLPRRSLIVAGIGWFHGN